jgi:V/A-type H+-transporting ATPase subunit E
MSLATIIQKIDAEAEASRQKLLAQAHAESERILEQGRVDAEQEAVQIRQHAEEDLQSFTNKRLATAQLQMRNQQLENRQRLLNEVFSNALEKILACDESQYITILKTILLSVTEERQGEILPAEADVALITEDFIAAINAELKEKKRKLSYRLSSKTAQMSRGCLIDFHDFEINYSLENILAGMWEQMKTEVSARLFGNGNN